MNTYKTAFSSIIKSISVLALAMMISGGLPASAKAQSEQSKDTPVVVQVETKYVCMINNQKFNKEQIAVEVDGQTYYGCCEMCKEKLRKDKASRWATDPVSGKKVDKAKAVIGADSEGKVYYFETAENLKKFKGEATHSEHQHNDNKKHDSHN
jgi:YHS domain-containing protein